MNVSKEQISIAKGVALLLMFAHHLYAFADRVPAGLNLLSFRFSPSLAAEHELGMFGKICVGMFIFISGLGLGLKRGPWSLRSLPGRIIPFYSVFVANFIILIGASYFLVPHGHVIAYWTGIDFSAKSILANLFLINPTYSMEWWFARLYILIILLIWPLCEVLSRKSALVLGLVSAALFSISWAVRTPDNFLFYQLIFTLGFLISRQVGSLPIPPFTHRGKLLLLCLSLFAIAVLARRLLGLAWEITLAPVCVWAAAWLPLQGLARKFLALLGKHSASMWLNHTFICYYWFNRPFFSVKYTPALMGLLLICSILLSFATDPLVAGVKRVMEWTQPKLGLTDLEPKKL